MQIVSWGDDLHEMTTLFSGEIRKVFQNLLKVFPKVLKVFGAFFFVCNSFALKVTFSSKRHFFIQERFNKLFYGIDMIIKCGI